MFTKRLFGLIYIALALVSSAGSAEFWYGVDGPVPLKIDSLKVTVKLENGFSYSEVLGYIDRVVGVIDDDYVIDDFVACSLSTGSGYGEFLDSLDALDGIYLVEPYYTTEGNFPLLVGEGIQVALHDEVSYEAIDSINAIYGVVIERERIGRAKSFTLKNTDSTGYRVVELANVYHNLPQTEYAHPNFSAAIVKNSYRLYDYYHQYQPHAKKVIGSFNDVSVWDFAGLNHKITVAVIDDGVASHEDLPPSRLLPGYDFANHDSAPNPGDICAHRMATSGIIAASHTTDSSEGMLSSSGVISMNPHVYVMPIKIFNDGCSDYGVRVDDLTDACDFAWTQGADILSNSWNFVDPDWPDIPDLNRAIERATVFGRNGLGCPVIFSSGNTVSWFPDPSKIRYPARLPYCFAVGATRLDDYRWGYSCYGPELDMVGPSDDGNTVPVWGLDQMDSLGYNPYYMTDCPPGANDMNYDCGFSGTSAACPLVAGAVSLLMAKDSTLNFEGYYYILRNSAVTELDWGTITPQDNEYGYGRVDAYRAMLAITRGDANNSGDINNGDPVYIVNYIFKGGPPPQPDMGTGDANCDGAVNVEDAVFLRNYIFQGGPEPPICFENDY
ncbi:MAG: S8 family serine peptidase [Candidatus Thorarchaeota archaeon]